MYIFHCCDCIFHAQLYSNVIISKQEREFALEVTLSDESKYTVYRTVKDIAKFHVSSLTSCNFPLMNYIIEVHKTNLL